MPGSIPAIGHPLELVVALEAVPLRQPVPELGLVALDPVEGLVVTVPHLELKIAGDCPDCSSGMRLPQVSCLL